MNSKSDDIEIIINDNAGGVKEEFFQSLSSRDQIGLQTSIKGSDFVFNCIHLLY